MAAQPHRKIKVNLIYSQGAPQKIYLRFLKWLLAYGRFIVVGVEFVVILAFVARFALDSTSSDNKKQINNEVQFIDSQKVDELSIRHSQFKLASIKTVYDQTIDWKKLLDTIASKTPAGVTLRTIALEKDKTNLWRIRLVGNALGSSDLNLLLASLKKLSLLSEVNLQNVSFGQGNLVFTVNATVQTKELQGG